MTKWFISCLEYEPKVVEEEKKAGEAEQKVYGAEKEARKMLCKRYTDALIPLKDYYSLFHRGKFSARLSFIHNHTIVFVITGFDLSTLLEEPTYYNTHQSFIELDGTLRRKFC